MLASLTADFPPSSLDAANGFGSSFGGPLGYIDGAPAGLPFQDFVQPSSNPFDFNHDLGLGSARGLDSERDIAEAAAAHDPVL